MFNNSIFELQFSLVLFATSLIRLNKTWNGKKNLVKAFNYEL